MTKKAVTPAEQTEVEVQGFLDYRNGACLFENPYQEVKELHEAWDRGWFKSRDRDPMYQGHAAYRDGASELDNPFISSPDSFAKWLQGWNLAQLADTLFSSGNVVILRSRRFDA